MARQIDSNRFKFSVNSFSSDQCGKTVVFTLHISQNFNTRFNFFMFCKYQVFMNFLMFCKFEFYDDDKRTFACKVTDVNDVLRCNCIWTQKNRQKQPFQVDVCTYNNFSHICTHNNNHRHMSILVNMLHIPLNQYN